MTPYKIREAEAALDYAESRYLRARGWEHTCDNPASMWLWQKALPDVRIVLVSQETAVAMQERADAISLKHWPKPGMTKRQPNVSDTPITDANTYTGWIKVDDGTDSPWHTDRQEWTKAEVARQLERQLKRGK